MRFSRLSTAASPAAPPHASPAEEPPGAAADPRGDARVLMLGMGWFPSSLGGLDRYFRSLFEQLPEAVGVVIGPAERAPAGISVAARHELALPHRALSFWLAARRAAGDGVDVVDAHFALYAAAPLLLGRLRRRATVFHFQGPWAEENVAAHDTSRVRFAMRKALERRVLAGADAHIVLSGAFQRVLLERYRMRPWEIHVWAPAVDLEAFTPGERSAARARLGLEQGAFVAACVRRLVPRMGIDDLLDAWGQMEGDLPPGSTLLIVGSGPLADELAARSVQPPLAGRVRLLGRVSDEELLDVYRAADVAVVPTLSFEGFGLVVLEAAACGTPSIVTNVGGLPDAAAPLDPSLVVPAADTTALRARLRAAADGLLPTRSATRSYAERYSWPRLAERHRALYRRLAAGHRDERLRVVYLDHVARLSGGEIAILRLLPHLQRVNAHVILGEEGLLAERLQQAGISVEVLPFPAAARDVRRDAVRLGGASPLAALHTLVYAARLAWRLRRLRPDLVHTNSLKSGVYGSLAARAAGIPLVWHLRDRLADDYIPKPAVRAIGTFIARMADAVIANSTATLETLPARARGHGSVIPDSVEVSAQPLTDNGGSTTFGMLGRIAPWKGQDLFLRAFADAFPAGRERAVLVGTPMFGEDDYERRLHDLVATLGITDRVEFRGFREDIWRELASFDVLVHASVIPEPFGQVVLEGMAAGLAVIAPDEGGPADVIDDGETGRLFASRDAGSLTAAMSALCADPSERRRLGAAAHRAVEEYRPQVLAERLEGVYEHVLQARR